MSQRSDTPGAGLDRDTSSLGLRLQQGHTEYLQKTEEDLFKFGPSFSESENRKGRAERKKRFAVRDVDEQTGGV